MDTPMPPPPPPAAADPSRQRIETVAVLLISLTAVVTAWTTFQSSKWSGEQTLALAAASATRLEAESFYADARESFIVDVQVFNQWVEAVLTDEELLADALEERFPPTLEEAFAEWIVLDLEDPGTPATPFDDYDYADDERGEELEGDAEELTEQAAAHNQTSDDYTAMTIIFAMVILFAALSDKVHGRRNRVVMVTLATVGLVGGVIVIAGLPITV